MNRAEIPDTWIEYWEKERIFRPMMKKMTGYFYRKSRKLLSYQENDVVLDFGCGPGYLEELLGDVVGMIYGVDTSLGMIEECRRKFTEQKSVIFYKLDRDQFTDLSMLGVERFSIIICLSVVQYFRNPEEIKRLIESAVQVALPGASFLIADIPVKSNVLLDTYELLRSAAFEGFFFKAIQFLFLSRFSEYYKVRSSRGLLCITISDLEGIIKEMHLEAQILRIPLTYNRRRVHMLIKLN